MLYIHNNSKQSSDQNDLYLFSLGSANFAALLEEELPDFPVGQFGDEMSAECAFFVYQGFQLPCSAVGTTVVLFRSQIQHPVRWSQALQE